ncbi:histidine kinase dimerization/phospho-acceptor domain-containing protein [Xinfangfangia sp. CPCC 101601]|uniref:histidine kinase n=1 Tax=Pseudogemmobacter lacusdianii TaxID=3069608 RepID=A0ABU0VXW8_9RHOB|nr:histidine kinase dimerization/phospho-acceptor domain-containing protein [Xinfangfangia sp. CPCC 101601]MDQ2066597.1 histidine kinase dimerization/phospho-acceptor domain-containing protein [Xinfangfangia sp. CPCC 101601]
MRPEPPRNPPRPWSIRGRLTRRILALVLLAWLGSIALTALFLDHEISEMMDEEMQAVAETTVQYLDSSPGRVIGRSVGINPGNGEQVLRIFPLEAEIPDAPWPKIAADGFHDSRDWRVLRVTAEDAVIEIGHSRAWRREEMLEAASGLLLLILPMMGLLVWGLGHSLRHGFTPLDRLTAAIRSRAAADLSPVADADLPVELAPLAGGLNLYVSRIDALRQSERRFIANASHELRTPVAAIRAQIELSADPEARAALPQLDSLTRRIERLLQLSRSEAGLGLGRGPTDLLQILCLLIREVSGRSSVPIYFDDGDLDRFPLAADPDALAILLRNLLENAVEHGNGPVKIRLSARELWISNPAASGFEEEQFAKGAGSSGLGLGLSIVRELAEAMRIAVQLRYENGRAEVGLRFLEVDEVP